MKGPAGYGIDQFGLMVESEPRMKVYAEAIRRAISPGCRMVDIGAGFGIFSILACKYGAGEVVAIEPDPAVELVMPLARANDCADRITVVRDISTNFMPDTKADVLVSDIRGTVPLFQNHIPTIIDARTRLLKPGGHQLPLRDTIRAAPVHAPRDYEPCERPWLANEYGLDLTEGHRYAVNIPVDVFVEAEDVLAEAQDLARLDYRTIDDPNLDTSVEFVAAKPGTAHGLLLWFEAEIGKGLTFSTAPGQPRLVYRQRLLPFERPVHLHEGQRLAVRVRARLIDGEYVWSWDTRIGDEAGGATVTGDRVFRQSSFLGRALSTAHANPHAMEREIVLTPAIEIDRDCLGLVGQGRSIGDIADEILRRHEGHFDSPAHVRAHLARLLARYPANG